MNLLSINKDFSTDDECIAFLEAQRWPDGIRCVTCGNDKVFRVTSSSKKQKLRKLYECAEPTCKQQFTVTSGTIMHDTRLPLKTWFMAIALITGAKKGISAKQVQRHLGLGSYKTAWHLNHRIREAMVETGAKMTGTVEVDETYIGGKLLGQGRRNRLKNKEIVVGIRQRGGNIKLAHVQDTKTETLYDLVAANVSRDVDMIVTDENVSYQFGLTQFEGKHRTIKHKDGVYVRGNVHTNTIESAFSLLKRGIVGNFHQVSGKHLHRYLNEFEFRFNNRENKRLFEKTLQSITRGKALPFAKLVH